VLGRKLAKPVDKMARPCYAENQKKRGKKSSERKPGKLGKLRFLRENGYLQGSSSKFEKR
jgi:hypothetical protein